MGDDCDGYFDALGIPFDPSWQDDAVYAVRSDGTLGLFEKKDLILCWFDTTFGFWNGSRYNLADARIRMSTWLEANNYDSFEDILEEHNANQT